MKASDRIGVGPVSKPSSQPRRFIMNNGRKVLAGIAMGAVLFGLAAAPAWADRSVSCAKGGEHGYRSGGHGMHGHRDHSSSHLLGHLMRHQKDIGLTDEQVGKLKAMALEQDKAQIRAHADVDVAKRELKSLVWDKNAELSAIETKVKEVGALKSSLYFARIKGKRDFFAVLTPEQKDKLKALREQGRGSHRGQMYSSETIEFFDFLMVADGDDLELENAPSVSAADPQTS